MKTERLHKMLAIASLFFLTMMIVDTYLPWTSTHMEVIDKINYYARRRHSTYSEPFVTAYSGNSYRMPATTTISFNYNDTLLIRKTLFFKSSVSMISEYKGAYYRFNIGMINRGYMVPILMFIIVVICCLNLLQKRVIKNANLNERFIFTATGLTVVLMLIYIFMY